MVFSRANSMPRFPETVKRRAEEGKARAPGESIPANPGETMPSPRTILCVFGTRPDAVKMAPVVLALKQRPERFRVRVVVTGQHREQLDQVLQTFGILPDRDLAIMQHGQTLAQITTRALEGLDV